jgi:HEAT repeat protein
MFSATSVFIILAMGAFGLLGLNRLRSKRVVGKEVRNGGGAADRQEAQPEVPHSHYENAVVAETTEPAVKVAEQPTSAADAARPNNSTSSALYGAYRVDQEVGKLVLGQPHRLDVLASRSADDRRAIEASLMKTILAGDAGGDARNRARQALEEYGFVARQCATMLLAAEACDRMAAARTLGEMKSPIALPFLLEALYDVETTVRNQAVVSIGELKLPAAIGALLDLARRQPEVPSTLLSRSLSACSVDGLDFFNDKPALSAPMTEIAVPQTTPEHNYEPHAEIEELPDTLQDGGLVRALGDLKDANGATRAQAIQDLGRFRAQISVQALVSIVRIGVVPAFRAQAISSLGMINHHSVFSAVLIAMADESREVRAAAARALNQLTFDRGDAYVYLLRTGDNETVHDVARACVQAGIVSEGIDRLASNDQPQAYEAFSLVLLLARAEMTGLVFEAIFNHPSPEVRLSAAKVLAATREPKVIDRLRVVATDVGVDDEVRTALLGVLQNADPQSSVPESGIAKNES